ncbi:MAG: Obg family GTPase CgtA [Gammaproteobacteria bacterium]|nr:Obg family GTPase CgtA [Gammaproteobacteria bacterium]
MKFVDEVTVSAIAGRGGDGCMSFLRRANYAKGGPDGGNGGAGGSVFLIGDSSLNTLVDLRFQPQLKAQNGKAGSGSLKKGANGQSLDVRVPCGTTVIDDETLVVIGDVIGPNQRLRVAQGGSPGRGNATFKSSTNRSPRQTTSGSDGERRELRLQLRVLADVGLLGLPNAGKSTLLNVVSASRPRIADYPFTTLHPSLGVVKPRTDHSFVMADVPGLIRGASQGLGLGIRFLRHLTRTSILLHLVEVLPTDESDPIQNLQDVETELDLFSEELSRTPIFTALTKVDLVTQEKVEDLVEAIQKIRPGRPVFSISAVTNAGINGLISFLADQVSIAKQELGDDDSVAREAAERREALAQAVLDRSLKERRELEDNSSPLGDKVDVVYRRN